MTAIGQPEIATQTRVVQMFIDVLGYDHEPPGVRNEPMPNLLEGELALFLRAHQGYGEYEEGADLVRRAIAVFAKAVSDTSLSLYDRNRAVYDLLRYGVKVKSESSKGTETVWLVDWKHPEKNRFAVCDEVTVRSTDPKAYPKRPDIVLYVNGIALAVLELKRSSVSVSEGIRQNLDNQKKEFIEPFFSTLQLVMAGNDIEGLRYGAIQTPEKYYLSWTEEAGPIRPSGPFGHTPLDQALLAMGKKARLLELIHDFIVFDAGIKKLCRYNQYFGIKAAQAHIRRREGGIIWHTQGSGKSLTMVWLAKWIRENVTGSRVVIITDRTELDEQIESVFFGVSETIRRTKSGADLIAALKASEPWLIGSLVHKFGAKGGSTNADAGPSGSDLASYIAELKAASGGDFKPKGDLYVFVDECHRTQSGDLHAAMKALLPGAVLIGFTGTPLLKTDKKKSIEIFGGYIHTYKFDQAVRDQVVLDLRYEARDIDQTLGSKDKIDQWFEAKTKGLTPPAKAQLKARWGTMQKVLSSRSRMERIVADILFDMETKDRLMSGRGNAMLVAGSIYEACKLYELFAKTPLKGKCAIVTSYTPNIADIKGEESGEGATETLDKYEIYRQMLADWFNEPPETAVNKAVAFEKAVKKKFIHEPGQMKLLIVVDKLLTGFDAPPATYLYIDKQMRDHGLFQAICRVNRLDGDDKEFGYIVDYKDLFRSLTGAIKDYTAGALDGYDAEDVKGLVKDRLDAAKERLDGALEQIQLVCDPVPPPGDQAAFLRYFSSEEHGNAEQLARTEKRRLDLYTKTAALVRAYADLASEMSEAGYSQEAADDIKKKVGYYEQLRAEVKLHSGDAIDLKLYEPAMRHLIDTYIQAAESKTISALDDLSLVELVVSRGADAIQELPAGFRNNPQAAAETIENNVRKVIINQSGLNPKYYGQMSKLLDGLIAERKKDATSYKEYLDKLVAFTKDLHNGPNATKYPATLNTAGKRALFDNLGQDETLALAVDRAVYANLQDGWRTHAIKMGRVRRAIEAVLGETEQEKANAILELVKQHHEY